MKDIIKKYLIARFGSLNTEKNGLKLEAKKGIESAVNRTKEIDAVLSELRNMAAISQIKLKDVEL
jgi:hypothetical protein